MLERESVGDPKIPLTPSSSGGSEQQPFEMLLVNAPSDFVGRTFTKMFNDGIEYEGRIISFNKLNGFWKVQYLDGQKEDFDFADMEQYLIEKSGEEKEPEKEQLREKEPEKEETTEKQQNETGDQEWQRSVMEMLGAMKTQIAEIQNNKPAETEGEWADKYMEGLVAHKSDSQDLGSKAGAAKKAQSKKKLTTSEKPRKVNGRYTNKQLEEAAETAEQILEGKDPETYDCHNLTVKDMIALTTIAWQSEFPVKPYITQMHKAIPVFLVCWNEKLQKENKTEQGNDKRKRKRQAKE